MTSNLFTALGLSGTRGGNMEADFEEEELDGSDSEDLSYGALNSFPNFLQPRADSLKILKMDHNYLTLLPGIIGTFKNLKHLDISNNDIGLLSNEIVRLRNLKTLIAKNNNLDNDSIPKDLGQMELMSINLSGNNLVDFPPQFTEISTLRRLFLGGNQIRQLPSQVQHMYRLEVLYLGGNKLTEIPAEMGYLQNLTCLTLCDNQLESLPPTLTHLRKLQSLSLHNNQLQTLPPELVTLNLYELSLRNNPLVVRFVRDFIYDPPSLLELAGRVIKVKNIQYSAQDLPRSLVQYLTSAHHCVNPRCKGVYFSSRVEHIKFVDFCGKYRLPLLEYLCSPNCTASNPSILASSSASGSESDTDDEAKRMQKVLLG
ncbi:leucine-rich repeat-containing protein 58-like [Lineus longissimus]|uniref:leucine-rich repeat-containing protein 58-like n=1 Tax=Lineus longissimus TaxID=88925 RepID=UPI00315D4359